VSPRRTFGPVDWLLATIIAVFLVGAVIAQAHSAPAYDQVSTLAR
jgi:hypothetical protein